METGPFYPVGMQDFDEIRERNAVYVDKTDLVYRMAHGPKHVFLSRPRRFGKSLLTSTLQCYFEGRKELFNGLAIDRLETEWLKHPVLHFDLAGAKGDSVEDVRDELNRLLDNYERTYGTGTNETSPGKRLSGLIFRAYEKTGQRVVLLIDEYDVPMLEFLQKPEILENVRSLMRDFYSRIKQNGSYLQFVFLTGISTFSQLGMFSELNNLLDITNMDEYASICGITIQELQDNFQPGIQKMAESWNCTGEEVVDKLRELYDGYHFTKSMVDVFNPYSLLNAFYGKKLDDYWFKTGTPAFVIHMLKKYKGQWKFDIEDIDGTTPIAFNRFSTPLEQARGPLPFLYQAGYLTIKEYTEEGKYVLGVPNTEVRLGLIHNLIPLYSAMDPDDALDRSIDISAALCKGDYDKALRYVQSFLAGVPFMEGDRKILSNQELCEAYYHRMLFIVFNMLHNGARAQVRQAVGMPDIVVTTRQYIYIIEVKLDSTPEAALQQIEEKQYAAPYLTEGKKIVKLGVNFSSETKTISEWKRG
jgi:hypothetical protein